MSETEDLKTLIREFRTSVTADLADVHRRIDEFAEEVRARFASQTEEMSVRFGNADDRIDTLDRRVRTAETAILNEIRALADRFDRRLERVELELYDL